VYNRNGKIVFKANAYRNTWDGYAFGEALPEGTYFFVMDLGDGKGVKHGTVTIIK
jgi:gliding motility-associated-like protein